MINNKCFYLIDKPLNYTSFDVLRVLRKKLQIKKLWHTWTLDPLASGLLLVWVGDYTKLITYLEKADKEYEFTINLDWTTDTLDLEWEINYISEEKQKYFKENLKLDQINEILQKKFLWKVIQTPPKYSALVLICLPILLPRQTPEKEMIKVINPITVIDLKIFIFCSREKEKPIAKASILVATPSIIKSPLNLQIPFFSHKSLS